MLAIKTTHAERLRTQITESLDSEEDANGRGIRTWVLDEEGCLRHTGENEQWHLRGRFVMVVSSDRFTFLFRSGKAGVVKRGVRGAPWSIARPARQSFQR